MIIKEESAKKAINTPHKPDTQRVRKVKQRLAVAVSSINMKDFIAFGDSYGRVAGNCLNEPETGSFKPITAFEQGAKAVAR